MFAESVRYDQRQSYYEILKSVLVRDELRLSNVSL